MPFFANLSRFDTRNIQTISKISFFTAPNKIFGFWRLPVHYRPMDYIEIKKAAHLDRAVSFPNEMDIFNHHFPSSPLLPGALSALILAEACGGTDWFLIKINGLRFRKQLIPNLPITVSCQVIQESSNEKTCLGKILSGNDTFADGEFVYSSQKLLSAKLSRLESKSGVWNSSQIRQYLPHGEPIVLIDQLVEAHYPVEIQNYLSSEKTLVLDQCQLVGTKIHTRSALDSKNYWLDQNILPSPVLSELVAQAGALTLAPFFNGSKPQVSLLGCDTEYFAEAEQGATVDTFLELTRVKRLGKTGNMIIFKSECYVGHTKIAHVNLNAMASF